MTHTSRRRNRSKYRRRGRAGGPKPGPARWPVPQLAPQHARDGYALWSCDVGEQFLGNVGPEQDRIDRPLEYVAIPGEYAPFIVGLWGDKHLGRVTASVEPDGWNASICRVEFKRYHTLWPNSDKLRIYDIPRLLPPENVAEVNANYNAAFWVTLQIPHDTFPGQYTANLRLRFQNLNTTRTVPITLNVIPMRFAHADVAFGMFYNLGRFPEGCRNWNDELAAFDDMAEHGQTSTHLGGSHDDPGMLKLDKQIGGRMRAEMLYNDVPFLLGGGGVDDTPAWERLSHADKCQHSAKYGARLRNMRVGHAWPEPVMYTDEVGQHHKHTLPIMQAARPYVRLATTMKCNRWETYKDYFDIWIISAGCAQPKFLDAAKAAGAEPWVYTCNRRADNALFERFYAGVYTWAHGLRGNFVWAYCDTPQGFSYVEPESDGPVATTGWEGRREGILDYRILRALDVTCANRDTPWCEAARMFLDDLRERAKWHAASYGGGGGEELLLAYEKTCKHILPDEYTRIRNAALEYLRLTQL